MYISALGMTDLHTKRTACRQNFGHTFKVRISKVTQDGNLEFINPVRYKEIYKDVLSRVVEFFNSDSTANLRQVLGRPVKKQKSLSEKERSVLKSMTQDLYDLDSDFRAYGRTRSVHNNRPYNKDEQQLSYIATGVDDLMLEQALGAKNIGLQKNIIANSPNYGERQMAKSIIHQYNYVSRNWVENKNHLLRSNNGKEIMLNITCKQVDKKGKPKFEISEYEFYEIKNSTVQTPQKRNILSHPYWDMLVASIDNQIKQITDGYQKIDIMEFLMKH